MRRATIFICLLCFLVDLGIDGRLGYHPQKIHLPWGHPQLEVSAKYETWVKVGHGQPLEQVNSEIPFSHFVTYPLKQHRAVSIVLHLWPSTFTSGGLPD
jgi:hypothetical protein